jgi:hypothetical protein
MTQGDSSVKVYEFLILIYVANFLINYFENCHNFKDHNFYSEKRKNIFILMYFTEPCSS